MQTTSRAEIADRGAWMVTTEEDQIEMAFTHE
jgi:hypothetical protein